MAVDPRKEHDDDDSGDDDGNDNDNDDHDDETDDDSDDDSDDDDDFETPRAAQTGGAGLRPLGGGLGRTGIIYASEPTPRDPNELKYNHNHANNLHAELKRLRMMSARHCS